MTVSQSVEQYRLRRHALTMKHFTAGELTAVARVSAGTTHSFLTQLRGRTPALLVERQAKKKGVGRPPLWYELTDAGVAWLAEHNLKLAAQLNEEAFHQDSALEPAFDPTEAAAGTSRGATVSSSFVIAFGRILAEIQSALEQRPSAWYLGAGQPTLLRVAEGMKPLAGSHIWSLDELSGLAVDLLTPWQKHRLNARGSLACTYHSHADTPISLRIFKEGGGIGVEIRRPPAHVPSMTDLHLPAQVAQFCAAPAGFVFVSGPIASGRSAALAAMTDCINAERAVRIVKIDEPTVFRHHNKKSAISQRQVGLDTPDFWTGVREALQENVDVLVISDVTDHRTVEMVLDASRRVLVLCRVDAPDIAEAIETLIRQLPVDERERGRRTLAAQLIGGIALGAPPSRAGDAGTGTVILGANEEIRELVINADRTALLRNAGDAVTGKIRVSRASESAAR